MIFQKQSRTSFGIKLRGSRYRVIDHNVTIGYVYGWRKYWGWSFDGKLWYKPYQSRKAAAEALLEANR